MKYMKVLTGKDTTNLVIHNIYPDGMPVNPNMMDPSIGGLKKRCKHVYEYVNAEACPLCGGNTHEPNYDLQNKLHRQHILDGKDKDHKCDKCGGTIIGAWDI